MPKEQQEHVNELLTEEELAALDDSDFIDEDGDDTPPVTATNDAPDDDDPDGDDDPDADDPTGQGDDPAPVVPVAEEEPDPEPEAQPVPKPDTKRLKELAADIDATQAEIDELTTQYEDGDFTSAEFKSKLQALNGKLVDVKADAKVIQNQIAQEDKSWNDAVTGYFTSYPGLKANDQVLKAFDASVRYVTSKFPSLSFEKQLARAHDQLLSEAPDLGLTDLPARAGKPTTPASETTPAPKPKPAAKPAPDDGMRTPPTTLAKVPSSEISGEADSAVLQMQKLVEEGNSDKIEAAMRKLTPEQRDAFSNMDL